MKRAIYRFIGWCYELSPFGTSTGKKIYVEVEDEFNENFGRKLKDGKSPLDIACPGSKKVSDGSSVDVILAKGTKMTFIKMKEKE